MRSKTYMSKINLQRGKLTVENRKSSEKKRICSEVSVNSPGNPWSQKLISRSSRTGVQFSSSAVNTIRLKPITLNPISNRGHQQMSATVVFGKGAGVGGTSDGGQMSGHAARPIYCIATGRYCARRRRRGRRSTTSSGERRRTAAAAVELASSPAEMNE